MCTKMTKILYVGDPHFKHTQKDECERLMAFVHEQAIKNKVDKLVILGDLNDTHGFLRTDNLVFWEKWLKLLSDHQELDVLVGNHDRKNQSDDSDQENSLSIYNLIEKDGLNIISSSVQFGIFAFVPYIHNKELFIQTANQLAKQGAKVLICHGEFDGGTYDNGYYIPDGIKPDQLNYDLVISGHIHTRMDLGKVKHPGAPRWMTSSDANKEKGLWLVTHDDLTGVISHEEYLDTSKVCTPIRSYVYKEGDVEPVVEPGSRTHIEFIGSSEWISKQKAKFKGRVSMSCKITDKVKASNRKTGNSLDHFINKIFETTHGIDKEKMVHLMKELGIL